MYTRAANMFKMAKNWSGMYTVFVCLLFRQITKIILKEEMTAVSLESQVSVLNNWCGHHELGFKGL